MLPDEADDKRNNYQKIYFSLTMMDMQPVYLASYKTTGDWHQLPLTMHIKAGKRKWVHR